MVDWKNEGVRALSVVLATGLAVGITLAVTWGANYGLEVYREQQILAQLKA